MPTSIEWTDETWNPVTGCVKVSHARAPFTDVVLCDKDPENADALRRRTAKSNGAHVLEGDCDQLIDDIIHLIPEHGLNIALLASFAFTS